MNDYPETTYKPFLFCFIKVYRDGEYHGWYKYRKLFCKG